MSEVDHAIAECDAQRVGSDREPGTAVQDVAPKVRRFVTLRDRKRCTVPGCRAARHVDVHHIVPRYLGGGHGHENLTLLCSGHHRALHEGHLIITGQAPNLTVVWKNGVVEPDAADIDASANMDTAADDVAVDARHPVQPSAADVDANADHLTTPHVGHDPCCASVDRGAGSRVTPQLSNYEWTVKKTEVIAAMKQMGFARDEARALVEEAAAQLQRGASRDDLMRKALRIYRRSPAGASLSR